MRNLLETPSENRGDALCINTAILNILSLYKFSTFVDLKSSFVCSNFVFLFVQILSYNGLYSVFLLTA